MWYFDVTKDEYRKRQRDLDAMLEHKIQNLSRDKEQEYITQLQKVKVIGQT